MGDFKQKSMSILEDIGEFAAKPAALLGIAVSSTVAMVIGFIIVAIIVYWLYKWVRGESFMPTATMRMQQNDNLLIGNLEHAVGGPDAGRNTSFFSKAVQNTAGGQFSVAPGAAPGQPGSLGYQVLNSPDFNCAGRVAATDSAWDWMQGVSSEGMVGVKNDNQLSALLAGH
jgi:hypothetical protein